MPYDLVIRDSSGVVVRASIGDAGLITWQNGPPSLLYSDLAQLASTIAAMRQLMATKGWTRWLYEVTP